MTKDFSDQIVANICITPDGTILHSKHRHDYIQYVDKLSGETYVLDGGNDYVKHSINELPALYPTVFMKHSHSAKRLIFAWRTFGKSGEFPEGKYLYLNRMSTEHIQAILDTQQHIKGTYVEVLFKDELDWRKSSNETIY